MLLQKRHLISANEPGQDESSGLEDVQQLIAEEQQGDKGELHSKGEN